MKINNALIIAKAIRQEIKEKRIERFKKSMDCKLWDKCKTKDCLQEAMLLGSCIWSKKLCYALDNLKEKGLIEEVNK